MRIVKLDRFLIRRLLEEERDGLSAEMARENGMPDQMMVAASYGLAYALIDGSDVPIGGALLPRVYRHAEASCFISRMARARHIVLAARWARAFLDRRQRDPQFRRVAMYVRANESWSESFPRSLGFSCEGLHEAWDTAGRDYWCFARVRRQ